MTYPTPDPLREALDTIHQIIADAKKERDRYGYIAATIRVNALRAGASDEETEAMVRGDKPFIDWLAKQYEAKRLEDAAAPQPAPAPAADERAEIERIICDAFTCDLRGRGDEDGAFWQTAADALLAAGYRKADGLADERETLAWAVVGGRRPIDSSDIFMREEDAKLYRGKGERIVRVAIRIVEGGA